MLSGITLVNRAGTMVLPFISLYLTQSHGFSVTQVGRLLGLYGLGSALGYSGTWVNLNSMIRCCFTCLISRSRLRCVERSKV